MVTNQLIKKEKNKELFFPELSFKVVGLLFDVHNELGRYAREKQYGDLIEMKLLEMEVDYKREMAISASGNIVDFIIEDKIILELKCLPRILKDSFRQIQNYLQQTSLKLGLLVNFREEKLKPQRIVKIDNPADSL